MASPDARAGGRSLRLAGDMMVGRKDRLRAVTDPAGINYEDALGKIVKRPVAQNAAKKAITVPDDEEEKLLAATAGPAVPEQRLEIHRFGSSGVTVIDASPPKPEVLTRRTTIDGAADLSALRNTNCSEACFSLAFSQDGSQIAGGFFDGELRIFDGQSGIQDYSASLPSVANFVDTKSPSVTCVRWLPEAPGPQMLATTDAAGALCLWQINTNKNVRALETVLQTPGGPLLSTVCISHDRSRLAVGGAEHVVRVYDINDGVTTEVEATGQVLGGAASIPGRICGHTLKIVCIRSDPTNPNLLYSAGIDRKILRWDLRAGSDAVGAIQGPLLTGDAVDISKDGLTLLTASHRAENPIQLFDMRRLSSRYSTLAEAYANYCWSADETPPEPRKGPSSCLLFGVAWDSETNRTIAAAGQHENKAKAFTRRDDVQQPLHTVGCVENGSNGGFWSVAAAPDGSRVAFGGVDGTVHLSHMPSVIAGRRDPADD